MKTKTVKKIKLCLMLVSVTLKKRAYCCRLCSFPASAAKLDAMVFISTCLGEEQQSTEGIASSFGVITAADRWLEGVVASSHKPFMLIELSHAPWTSCPSWEGSTDCSSWCKREGSFWHWSGEAFELVEPSQDGVSRKTSQRSRANDTG